MAEPLYAVIAYVPGRLGQFVDQQRDRLNPDYAAALAHVTVLPPRPLDCPPEHAVRILREQCAQWEPFDVAVGDAGMFWPVKSVVYLSLTQGGDQLSGLHQRLNSGLLARAEPFPFVPHLTIAQDLNEVQTRAVLAAVSEEWARYDGERSFRIETLCLVRQGEGHCWINLAVIPLSSFFVTVTLSTNAPSSSG
jgi:2'-5' RNA ligase